LTSPQLEAGPTLQQWLQAAQHVPARSKAMNAKIVEIAGIKK